MSNFFNVCSAHSQQIEGIQKTTYHKVGYLKVSSGGGYFLKLYQQPSTEFRIFSSNEDELPVIS